MPAGARPADMPSDGDSAAMPLRDRRLRGIWLRVGSVSCFALMAAAAKVAADRGVVPLEILFYRTAFSLPLVVTLVMLGPGLRSVRTDRPRAHVGRTVIGMISMFLTFQALALLPIAEAMTINFTAPLFATMLSALFLGEPVHRHRWGAIAIGFTGVLIVMQPGGQHVPIVGAAVALAAAVAIALATMTVRQIGQTEPPTTTVFWFTVGGAATTGLMVPFVARGHDPLSWAILLLIGMLGGASQMLNTASLRDAPIAALAPFDYLQLAWSVLLGWLLWSIVPGAATFAGGALIVAGGLYAVYREQRLHRSAIAAAALPGE